MAMKGSNDNVWDAFHGPNMGYIEEQYELYLDDPDAVDESLRHMFEEHGAPTWMSTTGETDSSQGTASTADLQKITSAMKLVDAIRRHGHLEADIFPVGEQDERYSPSVDPKKYGLSEGDLKQLDATLLTPDVPKNVRNAWEFVQHLKQKYSGSISFEFNHIPDDDEREWLYSKVETGAFDVSLNNEDKKKVLKRLADVEGFEQFLAKTFVAQKRFSIEGLDVMVPMLDHMVTNAHQDEVEHIMMGMAHRGRLNVLAHVLGKPYDLIFSEFAHAPDKTLVPSEGSTGINYGWTGDVKYHFGADHEFTTDKSKTKITLAHNPSHLEFVNPIVEGYTRAVQDNRNEKGYAENDVSKAFNIQIHGDAAFIGEGIIAETLNLSQLRGYETGGAVHIIANNLVGFTTNHEDGRSTQYASDLAKGFEIPVIHVNADDPIACLTAVEFAYQYRKQFKKDVLIDLVGYRRYGHNEMDEPRGTQPILYQDIDNHGTAYDVFADRLVSENAVTEEEAKEWKDDVKKNLRDIYDNMKESETKDPSVPDLPKEVVNGLDKIETAVAEETLQKLNEDMLKRPEGFTGFKKLEKILKRREKAFDEGEKIDWALGEALAFASILKDGTPIRMSGQDTERGTFAHRHAVLHDVNEPGSYSPFHGIEGVESSFSIYNSPLSEAGVLGFEYGYSVQSTDTLVLWEAQYGDFANTAQVIFDQFIAAGRAKWGQIASMVMLLPHGYEGQGPEHSSARLERFLQLSAENNWTVANVTTAGQYFHLLRRQAAIVGTVAARPLVLMTPKSLIRNQHVAVDHKQLSTGKFNTVLEQEGLGENPDSVKRLVIGSGKVMVDIEEELEDREPNDNVHVVRLEQIYPFPEKELQRILKKYKNIEEIVWVQEEPKNMGSWDFVKERIQSIKKVKQKLNYVGRPYRSSPAVGDPNIHKSEQNRIVNEALTLD
ncbi:2-oxoglutarate dehydrogenase E1 component [Tenuibacillus multivorans]|uniref:2-oxoglutarate dehydrogenase E1 component n=1 Tax=Tenuibacillus multivorans TaxID=237069 RepID=A0A1H0EUQ0_9BACI|nr:2-oxoglutarate dehydrogenase E1 component [Tenuibacillus multivorans]SDN86111.1 2-oxoglutarate dehydrogenase E1 component [Tenuibacillus multivorans]